MPGRSCFLFYFREETGIVPVYDVVVIGAGLPGLAAAVLLARANRRVVVFDPAAEPGGVLAAKSVDHISFASGPVITQGFEPGGPLRVLHATMGLPISSPSNGIAYQVALPDRRITVYSDLAGTLEELRREFAPEIDIVVSIVRDLQAAFIKQADSRLASIIARRRSAETFLRSRRISRGLSSFFDVQARFFYGQPLRALSLADLATMVAHPPMRLPGGFHALALHLRDLFTSVGGTYRSDETWPELQAGRHRKPSITAGNDHFDPQAIIVNSGWNADRTLFIGIQEQGIPVAMSENVLCLASYDRPEDLFVLTALSGQEQDSGAERITPLTATFIGPQARRMTREDILAQVRSLIPFIDDHIALIGERDFSDRMFPFPESLAGAKTVPPSGHDMMAVKAAKQLYLLQDRVFAVNQAIGSVRRLIHSLA